MALERVTMLEDQLAASSQEVMSDANKFLHLNKHFTIKQHLFNCFCLSFFFQVISLRDQIKRRQQGVDGGKDVREGFLHVGSSWFCAFVSKVNVGYHCVSVCF